LFRQCRIARALRSQCILSVATVYYCIHILKSKALVRREGNIPSSDKVSCIVFATKIISASQSMKPEALVNPGTPRRYSYGLGGMSTSTWWRETDHTEERVTGTTLPVCRGRMEFDVMAIVEGGRTRYLVVPLRSNTSSQLYNNLRRLASLPRRFEYPGACQWYTTLQQARFRRT
jgi:hypothetical protein